MVYESCARDIDGYFAFADTSIKIAWYFLPPGCVAKRSSLHSTGHSSAGGVNNHRALRVVLEFLFGSAMRLTFECSRCASPIYRYGYL